MADIRKLNVFLCHASDDKKTVRELYQRLTNSDYEVWLDEAKLLPGQEWELEIPRAVKSADVVVACLSKNSVSKEGYVQKELRIALDVADEKPEGTIFMVPVRLDDCIVPTRLNKWQWVDLFEEEGYRKLLLSLDRRAEDLGVQDAGNDQQAIKPESQDPEPNYDLKLAYEQAEQIKEFNLRLRKAMPGSYGYVQAKSKVDINRVMDTIGKDCEKYALWWNSEYQHHNANPVIYYPEKDMWVFDGNESKIVDLWVYKHPTTERQYVIIQTESNSPFGIYDPPGKTVEEAAYFQGRYVTYDEYYDGYTLIDGQSVELTDAEYRCRYLTSKFFIFAPQMSVYIWGRENRQFNDEIKNEVHDALLSAGKINVDLLRPLEKLKRAYWMTYLD